MVSPSASHLRRSAAERENALPLSTSCYRWVDEAALTVDRFGPVAVLNVYAETHEESLWADALMECPGVESVYVKRRPREARHVSNVAAADVAPSVPLRGKAYESLLVQEAGARFEIRPGNGLSVGLYLDARDARAFVRREARGRNVLNAFAYTCGFAVAALGGGAHRVLNVDLSRKVLDWGQENLKHNAFAPVPYDFVAGDTFEWLKRLAKRGEKFDAVVMDPPGFATSNHRRFSAAQHYHQLVSAAEAVAAPDALLLTMCNVAQLELSSFQRQVERGLGGRAARLVKSFGASAVDFAQPGALKCLVWELGAPRPVAT